MNTRELIEQIDEKLIQQGWIFIGPILHYEQAWKQQAGIYERNGHYIVSGIDSSGEKELHQPIEKAEALQRVEQSLEEIREQLFSQ